MILAKAIVIDDDPFVRSTLSAGLAHYGIQVVQSFDNGSSAISAISNIDPDVAIVDLDLGTGPSGIDICHSLRTHKPNLGLILLTSYQDPRIFDPAGPALPKGCRFISKSELNDFKLLVESVLAARAKPLAHLKHGFSAVSTLTSIQLEVLKSLANGLSSSEIAAQRGVSVKAVESSIAKIQAAVGLGKSKSFNQRVQLTRAYFMLSGKKPPGA
jgi:DNA-binding NarL/FixJ family response regulator